MRNLKDSTEKAHYDIISVNYSFLLCIVFCDHPNFLLKTETGKCIRMYMDVYMAYLLLTECQHFAILRKNDQKTMFQWENLNLKVKFQKFPWISIKFHENPWFSKVKKKLPENSVFSRFLQVVNGLCIIDFINKICVLLKCERRRWVQPQCDNDESVLQVSSVSFSLALFFSLSCLIPTLFSRISQYPFRF